MKGRGQMIHERICNVKLNLQFFGFFLQKVWEPAWGAGLRGLIICGWEGKSGYRHPLSPTQGTIEDFGFGIWDFGFAKFARYGATRCTHLRRGAAVRCWKRGVTDMALGVAGQATTQAPQPMQRAGFM